MGIPSFFLVCKNNKRKVDNKICICNNRVTCKGGCSMQENKMGTMPVNKLLITMSLPIMVSMLIQALYNIVDSMFVAQISEDALTAVSLAFPIQNLMIAVSTGTGVGINALLARSLGQKNKEKASKAANNGLFLALLSSIAFMLLSFGGIEYFFKLQNTSAVVSEYGVQYLNICCIFSVGIFMQITYERILQATGRTFYTMITQGSGAIINIILDPIFIFGMFGMPKMGVAGAAIATVIGQLFAMVLSIYINHKVNHDVSVKFRGFRPDMETIKNIYVVGIPSIIMASISSVMTFGMNQILLVFNNTAAAFYGIYIKLQSFVFMPIFGLNNGLVPIISYNFGARNKERITQAIRLGCIYAVGLMLLGLVVFELFPAQLLSIFNASDKMIEIGVPGLRIISIHFALAGICIVLSSTFQALNHSMCSLIVSVARQLMVLLPVAFVLSLSNQLDLVWLSYPIAEFVSFGVSVFFFYRIYHNQIQYIQ